MTLKLQPRRLTPCHRHPDQPLSSLCAPCLRERLSILSPSSSAAATASGLAPAGICSSSSSSSAALSELRRCKTFSADKCESLGLGLSYEPRRRSCEVRARSSLEDLLTVDDEGSGAVSTAKCKVESKNLGLLVGTYPVPELREEEEEDEESDCEIRVSADVAVPNAVSLRASDLDLEEPIEDSKTMKEFIDLEFQSNKPVRRDLKEIAGSFWIAASVFSKKIQIWKGKQKSERPAGEVEKRPRSSSGGGGGLGEMRLEKLRGRRLKDVQPEAGEYGFGRRSCDSDPRFSIDLGRASIDGGRISVDGIGKRFFDTDPRFSLDLGRASVDCGRIPVEDARQGCFDAPRASWDGYMNGRMVPRGPTPVVSVIENAMATVYGFDNRVFVENEDRKSYGAIVARHLDSVSLHMGKKNSADQSTSKTNVEEDGESRLVSCTEKPPGGGGGGVEIFHGTKLLITEKELMDSRMSSLKDDSSDSFDTASKDMTSSASSSSTGIRSRKLRKWGKLLNVWSLLSRQNQSKPSHDEERFARTNAESTISDPSKRVEREGNEEEVSSDPNWKLTLSHSVASSRSLYKVAGSALGMRGESEAAKSLSLKRHEAGALDRKRSARYSPNNAQSGMLRFYLTPLRSARQKKFGKNRLSKCHSSGRTGSRP